MIYPNKTVTLTALVLKAECSASDYIIFYSDGGSGVVDLNTPFTPRIYPKQSGLYWAFVFSFTITNPIALKFKYKIFDAAGNEGTTSAEVTADVSDLAPSKAPQLQFVSYNAVTKVLSLGV